MLLFVIATFIAAAVCNDIPFDDGQNTPEFGTPPPMQYSGKFNRRPNVQRTFNCSSGYPASPNRIYRGRPVVGQTNTHRQNHGSRYPFTRFQQQNLNHEWRASRYDRRYPH